MTRQTFLRILYIVTWYIFLAQFEVCNLWNANYNLQDSKVEYDSV